MPSMKAEVYKLLDGSKVGFEFLDAIRPATYFTDVEAHYGPFETMTEPEVNVLLELALRLLNSLPEPPVQGTLCIYGQKHGQEATPIIQANLRSGPCSRRYAFRDSRVACGEVVSMATDRQYEQKWQEFKGYYSLERKYPVNTEIYEATPGDPAFVGLITTYGHFVICLATGAGGDLDEVVMWGLAQAIALLRTGDSVLDDSLAKMRPLMREDEMFKVMNIMDAVQKCFHELPYPVLQSWKNCRNIEAAIGTTKLFFE